MLELRLNCVRLDPSAEELVTSMVRPKRRIAMIQVFNISKTRSRLIPISGFVLALAMASNAVWAHFFVEQRDRVGPSPQVPGHGWFAEMFLNIPDGSAITLLNAEIYVADKSPDFTFRTTYIDFPAGPIDGKLDTEFATIGEFLDDYVTDVSDPSMLDEPFGNFVIRFNGLLNVQLRDSSFEQYGLPLLVDFATQAHGGYRTKIGTTSIYRVQNSAFVGSPFMTENAVLLGLGLFPIQITYAQQFDPTNAAGNEMAGVELYSWHPNGLPWPAGAAMNHPMFGDMTVTSPNVIYQPDQIPVPAKGDFNGDSRCDIRDMQALQECFSGDGVDVISDSGDPACLNFDFDDDGDVDLSDSQLFGLTLAGPDSFPYQKGDYTTNLVIDLEDFQWLQSCFSIGGEDERGSLPTGCEWMDFDDNGVVNLFDFDFFQASLPVIN